MKLTLFWTDGDNGNGVLVAGYRGGRRYIEMKFFDIFSVCQVLGIAGVDYECYQLDRHELSEVVYQGNPDLPEAMKRYRQVLKNRVSSAQAMLDTFDTKGK